MADGRVSKSDKALGNFLEFSPIAMIRDKRYKNNFNTALAEKEYTINPILLLSTASYRIS